MTGGVLLFPGKVLYVDLLGGPVEDRTAIHILPLVLGHGLGAGLGREDAVVAVPLQLRQEELVELIRLHLLHQPTHESQNADYPQEIQ